MSAKLHVGNISSAVLEDDLKVIFSQFGLVETVEIARLNFTQCAGRTIGVSRSRVVSPG